MALFFFSGVLGIAIAFITAYLLLTFNNKLVTVLLSIIDISGSGGIIYACHKYFEITDQNLKLWSSSVFILSFLVSEFVFLKAVCYLIKDKNDKDLLRIRDIILGRQDYIIKYYEMRKAQIDEKLQLPMLEEREKKLKEKENALASEKAFLERNKAILVKQGKKKPKIILPDRKEIFISQDFIDKMPSYFDGFSNCISSIDYYTSKEIDTIVHDDGSVLENIINQSFKDRLYAFLINIETNILSSLFGNSSQVRVHFRVYNPETKNFELLSGVIGREGKPIFVKHLTPIPYSESMIEKSFKCKRAIIKSINSSATRYNGVNSTIWQDYMTYTFYNIFFDDETPCLSFGISVKNAENYRDLFYFLNYASFETYLNSCLERLDDVTSIKTILYTDAEYDER